MKIVFGLWADGGAWPDHGGDALGSLGQPVVGPIGLVDILETLLGLGGPATAQVVRIARFQFQLESLGGTYFWSRSLAVDSWSTARTLLAWRDDFGSESYWAVELGKLVAQRGADELWPLVASR